MVYSDGEHSVVTPKYGINRSKTGKKCRFGAPGVLCSELVCVRCAEALLVRGVVLSMHGEGGSGTGWRNCARKSWVRGLEERGAQATRPADERHASQDRPAERRIPAEGADRQASPDPQTETEDGDRRRRPQKGRRRRETEGAGDRPAEKKKTRLTQKRPRHQAEELPQAPTCGSPDSDLRSRLPGANPRSATCTLGPRRRHSSHAERYRRRTHQPATDTAARQAPPAQRATAAQHAAHSPQQPTRRNAALQKRTSAQAR